MLNKEKNSLFLFCFLCVLVVMCPYMALAQDTKPYAPPSLSFDSPDQASEETPSQAVQDPPHPLKKPKIPKLKSKGLSDKAFKIRESKAIVANMAEVKSESLIDTSKTLKEARDSVLKPVEKPSSTKDMQVFKLSFARNSIDITYAHSFVLEDVLKALHALDNTNLSIDAYATLTPNGNVATARRVALSRGLSVRDWFIQRGVQPQRMQIRALGNDGPRVSSDYVYLNILK